MKKLYLLDYNYDYELDNVLNEGFDSKIEFLRYASKHIMKSKYDYELDFKELGCTGFTCFNKDGEQIMGRNFDYKKSSCTLVWAHPKNGYKSVSLVDSDTILLCILIRPIRSIKANERMSVYLPLDGINEKGLSIGVLQVKAKTTRQNTGKKKILTTLAIRAILDKCATVDEAIELLNNYDMVDMLNCNYHFLISDATGKSVVVEYVNNEMRVVPQEEDRTLAVTNFYLSKDGKDRKPEGIERYKKVKEELKKCKGICSEMDAMKILNSVHFDYKHEIFPWRIITLWSCVFNCAKRTLTFVSHLKYGKVYLISPTKPCEVEVLEQKAEISEYTPPID